MIFAALIAGAICLLSAGAGIAGVETDHPALVITALAGLLSSAAVVLTIGTIVLIGSVA